MLTKTLIAAVLSLGLAVSMPVVAGDSASQKQSPMQPTATESFQTQTEADAAERLAQKRERITADAVAAVDETRQALDFLANEEVDEAMAALERATGKLELILARAPEMALAPVDMEVVTHDVLANPETVRALIREAQDYLKQGEVQKARPLVANLASEIVLRTTSIPLATYPDAIKAVAPLLDDRKVEEAKTALELALSTLVVTTDEVVPLPILRAGQFLDSAEALAENEERSSDENEALANRLAAARTQLEMAELLGYGSKKAFKPLYEQLESIAEKTSDGAGGTGWFDKIRQQLAELF